MTNQNDRQLFIVDNLTSGLSEVAIRPNDAILVYLSPSNGVIRLKGNCSNITLSDISYKIVHEVKKYQSNDIINLSHLGANVYFLKALNFHGEIRQSKVVITQN